MWRHMLSNVEVTGVARLYRVASSDRRERGRLPGWADTLEQFSFFEASLFTPKPHVFPVRLGLKHLLRTFAIFEIAPVVKLVTFSVRS